MNIRVIGPRIDSPNTTAGNCINIGTSIEFKVSYIWHLQQKFRLKFFRKFECYCSKFF